LSSLDREKAAAGDREVERFAGFLQRPLRHVGVGLAQRHARVHRPNRRAALGIGEQHLAKAVLRGFVGLEPWRAGVGEVV
jgi:hypothetical protein